MKNNFWKNLNKPFFCLAPMADVTDPAFRVIIAKYGKPDVMWTEFVSADGLCHPKGREKLLKDLEFTEAERPVVAQLFSSNPDNMREVAKLCAELGFDGVDINMGCPDRAIEKQGCGSAMIKTPDKAVEIIRAAKEGIKESGRDIPLSVKTRVGYNKEIIDEWIPVLLNEDIQALTIHARTRKDLSQVPANWDYVTRVVALRDALSPDTVIIGNGDVVDMDDGLEKVRKTGCDGIMIGRALFGNPWIFNKNFVRSADAIFRSHDNGEKNAPMSEKKFFEEEDDYRTPERYWLHNDNGISLAEKLSVMIEHSELFIKLLGNVKNFAVMKKHYKAYANGFPGAKELRIKLMESKDVNEVKQIVAEFLAK